MPLASKAASFSGLKRDVPPVESSTPTQSRQRATPEQNSRGDSGEAVLVNESLLRASNRIEREIGAAAVHDNA
jgi:hypothetical protein